MLLQLLDPGVYTPQTMAFAIDAADAALLRESVPSGDFVDLWAKHNAHYEHLLRVARWRIETASLLSVCAEASGAAASLGLEADLTETMRWLGAKGTREVHPSLWISVASQADAPKQVGEMIAAGAHLIVKNRVKVLLDALRALSADHPPPAPLQTVSQGTVLEMVVGPWTRSSGPGPFLPVPKEAEALGDKGEVHLLQGAALDAAEDHVRSAQPTRAWHGKYDASELDKAQWDKLVAEHWPRLRDRFAALLAKSTAEHRAVLMVGNDLSHPWSTDLPFPERVV